VQSAKEEEDKVRLSLAMISFLCVADGYPELQDSFCEPDIAARLCSILDSEVKTCSVSTPDLPAERTWTGRDTRLLLQELAGKQENVIAKRGRVHFRILTRMADVLQGVPDVHSLDGSAAGTESLAVLEAQMWDVKQQRRDLSNLGDDEWDDRVVRHKTFFADDGIGILLQYVGTIVKGSSDWVEDSAIAATLDRAKSDGKSAFREIQPLDSERDDHAFGPSSGSSPADASSSNVDGVHFDDTLSRSLYIASSTADGGPPEHQLLENQYGDGDPDFFQNDRTIEVRVTSFQSRYGTVELERDLLHRTSVVFFGHCTMLADACQYVLHRQRQYCFTIHSRDGTQIDLRKAQMDDGAKFRCTPAVDGSGRVHLEYVAAAALRIIHAVLVLPATPSLMASVDRYFVFGGKSKARSTAVQPVEQLLRMAFTIRPLRASVGAKTLRLCVEVLEAFVAELVAGDGTAQQRRILETAALVMPFVRVLAAPLHGLVRLAKDQDGANLQMPHMHLVHEFVRFFSCISGISPFVRLARQPDVQFQVVAKLLRRFVDAYLLDVLMDIASSTLELDKCLTALDTQAAGSDEASSIRASALEFLKALLGRVLAYCKNDSGEMGSEGSVILDEMSKACVVASAGIRRTWIFDVMHCWQREECRQSLEIAASSVANDCVLLAAPVIWSCDGGEEVHCAVVVTPRSMIFVRIEIDEEGAFHDSVEQLPSPDQQSVAATMSTRTILAERPLLQLQHLTRGFGHELIAMQWSQSHPGDEEGQSVTVSDVLLVRRALCRDQLIRFVISALSSARPSNEISERAHRAALGIDGATATLEAPGTSEGRVKLFCDGVTPHLLRGMIKFSDIVAVSFVWICEDQLDAGGVERLAILTNSSVVVFVYDLAKWGIIRGQNSGLSELEGSAGAQSWLSYLDGVGSLLPTTRAVMPRLDLRDQEEATGVDELEHGEHPDHDNFAHFLTEAPILDAERRRRELARVRTEAATVAKYNEGFLAVNVSHDLADLAAVRFLKTRRPQLQLQFETGKLTLRFVDDTAREEWRRGLSLLLRQQQHAQAAREAGAWVAAAPAMRDWRRRAQA